MEFVKGRPALPPHKLGAYGLTHELKMGIMNFAAVWHHERATKANVTYKNNLISGCSKAVVSV